MELLIIITAMAFLAISFLPTIIAHSRRHNRTGTIFFCNLLISIIIPIFLSFFALFLGFGVMFALVPFWWVIFFIALLGKNVQSPRPATPLTEADVQQVRVAFGGQQ
jgi:hypothetical protein